MVGLVAEMSTGAVGTGLSSAECVAVTGDDGSSELSGGAVAGGDGAPLAAPFEAPLMIGFDADASGEEGGFKSMDNVWVGGDRGDVGAGLGVAFWGDETGLSTGEVGPVGCDTDTGLIMDSVNALAGG